MTVNVAQQTEIEAPLETCFEYVDEWRNVSDWLVGVETFTPVGEQDRGLGSVFDVVVHVGIRIRTRLEVTDYAERRLIEFESVQGFTVRNRWNFEPIDDRRTLITAETELRPPFGPAGKAMATVLKPATRKVMARSADRLKGRIESW